ncbi:hypothetical protein niasHT_008464 [Heterodera trifolii]|uniref:Uncharacterized protein n=1 Tax=Heterodera trifolii TaxID=157864 RepID=A0ABD2M5L2_9BILA
MLNKFFFTFSAPLFLLFTVLLSTDNCEAMDEIYENACKPACRSLSVTTCDKHSIKAKDVNSRMVLCYCEWKTNEGCVPKDAPSNDVATAN